MMTNIGTATGSNCASHSLTAPKIRKPVSLIVKDLDHLDASIIAEALKKRKPAKCKEERAQVGGREIFQPK